MFDYHRQHGIGNMFYDYICIVYLSQEFVFNSVFIIIEIRIARIFNTYGPRMNIDDGRVVSNFIAQALR